jgi:L,D-transpeptidase ErfK/SrfK
MKPSRTRPLAAAAAVILSLWAGAPAVGAPAPGRVDVIGEVGRYRVVGDETLLQVAREKGLGYVEFMAANLGVDPWVPGVGTEVVVPDMHVLPDAPRRGIVINLTEMRLYLFSRKGEVIGTWPIGIGREGAKTPLGTTRIVRKQLNPSWYPTANIKREKPELPDVVPPGPDNPLGDRALYLGWPSYLIHGTNKPYGVGRRVSHGCIRLYPEDIVELYDRVSVGTPVTVVDQPIKLGWRDGTLYLQIHPSKTQADQIEAEGRFTPEPVDGLEEKVVAAAGDRVAEVDWTAVARAAAERTGVPVAIISPPPDVPTDGAAPGDETATSESHPVLPPIY